MLIRGVLWAQVANGQQAAMSGVAYWTHDAGGYAGGDPDSPSFQQLIVRWMQLAAVSPLMRLHGHRSGGAASGGDLGADPCGYTAGEQFPLFEFPLSLSSSFTPPHSCAHQPSA